MHLVPLRKHIVFASIISALVVAANSSALAQSREQPLANSPTSSSAGLILKESAGELRVRRPGGKKIRLHHHPHAEEILFIHRGAGIVRLGSREAAVSAGATVYVPRNVSVGWRRATREASTLSLTSRSRDDQSGRPGTDGMSRCHLT